jgi:broad specificity phosphatase PhoE
MQKTTVYLIRHGVTSWNKLKKYCGYIDVPLSAQGRLQAKRLANRIKTIKIDAVYSSDLKRAVKTAGIIFGSKRQITKMPDLQEMNFGVLEGLNHNQIMEKYPIIYSKWIKDPYKNHIPKGERINKFQKRITAAVDAIAAQNKGKTVAVVCHGGAISVLVMSILKRKAFWKYVPRSTSVTIVEYKGKQKSVKLFNCIEHLS